MPDGGVNRRTRCHLNKTPERAESASSDDSKSAEKGVNLSEPAITLPIPEAKQQEQTGEPPKAVATSITPPGPVTMQPVRPQGIRRPPGYLKDSVCK